MFLVILKHNCELWADWKVITGEVGGILGQGFQDDKLDINH